MSAEELRSAIDTLRVVSPRLNTITNHAAEVVRSVETFLNEECRIGIPASVEFGAICGEPDEQIGSWYLGYHRAGGKFRITVYTIEYGQVSEDKPWSDWNRDIKLESFEYLPKLLTEIAKRANQQISTVENTAKKVIESITSIVTGSHTPTENEPLFNMIPAMETCNPMSTPATTTTAPPLPQATTTTTTTTTKKRRI